MPTAENEHIDEVSLEQLFAGARTYSGWLHKPVPDEVLRQIYDEFKWGPTSANTSPGRIVFVKSPEAKERLLKVLAPLNVEKTKAAPVTAIFAYDTEFHEHLPRLFPQADARSWFAGNDSLIHETAFRNSSLQGGYFILAARALGLDCGPMSGFDAVRLNAEFFPDGKWKVNFICNLGYGDKAKLYPRNPRLTFEEACRII